MTYSTFSINTVHSTQTTIRKHTNILNIVTQIMQTVMKKTSFTDIQIHYSEEVIINQYIAPGDLQVKVKLELSFISTTTFIIF